MTKTLYVGTDVSEAVNPSRFYDAVGTEVGRGLASPNDLLGSELLGREALERAERVGAEGICSGIEATNVFW